MINTSNRLVLIDGHAIIHRAYHALPALTSSSGQQANAVYGFISMLIKVASELNPKYLGIAFDLPAPTFRHEAYIAYQAHRPHMDDGLREQIVLVKESVKAAGITMYSSAGFEADDVIGTLCYQATKDENIDEVIVVTGDRDMLQLVNHKVKLYMPIKGLTEARLFDLEGVKEYMGVPPSQMVDYKALIGDQSDNYPGVPGIGPKTAVSLLEKHQNLDGIYKNLQNIGSTTSQKLERGKESAYLSQTLAQISKDAPVSLDLKEIEFKGLEGNNKLLSKLKEFGFRSLIKRLGGEEKKEKKKDGQMGLL